MIEVLEEIKRLIKIRHTAKIREADQDDAFEIQAVTAMLLMEAAYGDEEYVWCEHRSIIEGLKRAFGLTRSDVNRVLEHARSLRPPLVKLSDATTFLAQHLEDLERRSVVELLWRIIDADGTVQEWEQVFGDHIASALGLDVEVAASVRRDSRN